MLNYSTGDPLRPWIKHIDDYFPILKAQKEAKQIIYNDSKALTNKEAVPVNSPLVALKSSYCPGLHLNKQSLILGGIALYLILRR